MSDLGQSEAGPFAKSESTTGAGPLGEVLRFLVAKEIVDQATDWSQPVQFKFERREDGTVEMILRTVN